MSNSFTNQVIAQIELFTKNDLYERRSTRSRSTSTRRSRGSISMRSASGSPSSHPSRPRTSAFPWRGRTSRITTGTEPSERSGADRAGRRRRGRPRRAGPGRRAFRRSRSRRRSCSRARAACPLRDPGASRSCGRRRAMPASSRRSIETGSSMPSAAPTARALLHDRAERARPSPGRAPSSPSVAPVSAVTGLKATLPISLSQSCPRISSSTGHFSPPATNASEIARQRSDNAPSGSPIVKRVPSTCLTTPGSAISVAG